MFLDFEKAFHSVPHNLLLFKLEIFSITDPLLRWCSDFLLDRFQCAVKLCTNCPMADHLALTLQGGWRSVNGGTSSTFFSHLATRSDLLGIQRCFHHSHVQAKRDPAGLCQPPRYFVAVNCRQLILARILLNRLTTHLEQGLLPESQCGFCKHLSTIDERNVKNEMLTYSPLTLTLPKPSIGSAETAFGS